MRPPSASYLDQVPYAGITRIRDLMYAVDRPFRLDQGDVSFDAPESFKQGMRLAIEANESHYLATSGLPRLRQLIADKLRHRNSIPVDSPDEVLVTNGGIHGMYLACQALLEPGDEVLLPDPAWPASRNNILAARAVPVPYPLHERCGWRFDAAEIAARVTPRTRVLYLNSPGNPAGGVSTRGDIEAAAALAREHDLWVMADEAYEDLVYDGAAHLSSSQVLRDRLLKLLFLTTSNVSSVVQYGGIAALEAPQDVIVEFRRELQARRDLFYAGLADAAGGILFGAPPLGAFYAFLRIDEGWHPPDGGRTDSRSWAFVEHLIARARVGCVPGVDFGSVGEQHVRFCFARERAELTGALAAMAGLLRAG